MKREKALPEMKWNVEELYKNKYDFLSDLDKVIQHTKLMLTFKGTLNSKEGFLKFKLENESISPTSSKLGHYLKILHVEQNHELATELEQIYSNEMQQFDGEFTWISEELKNIGEIKMMEWIDSSEELKPYKFSYKQFFKNIKYLLPEHDRKLLAITSNSSSLIDDMYDSLRFKDKEEKTLEYNDKVYQVNQSTISDIINNSDPIKDQELRALMSLKYSEDNKNRMHTYTKVYESIIKEEIENAQLVGMKSYKENFFDDDDFDLKSFENLFEFCSKNSSDYYRYYEILKKHFGFTDKYYGSDGSLPLVKHDNVNISVKDGKQMIREAVKVLGEEYLEELENAWATYKVDYFEDKNKSTGAFTIRSYYYDSLVSMNWTDDIDSVSTLAHEIGHAVHNNLAKKYQPRPLNEFSNMVAEVASTLNEHLLFDYLYDKATTNSEKIYLLQQRIEFIFSNFFSAISEALFEYEVFNYVESGGSLTADFMGEKMKETNKKILGTSVFNSFTKDRSKYGWISVTHFFDQPFYIYKYAVSVAVSFKIYQDVKEGKAESALNYLKDGGCIEPVELFTKYGFDPKDSKSYIPLVNEVKRMINTIEELLKNNNSTS